jgi:hypothetical protein
MKDSQEGYHDDWVYLIKDSQEGYHVDWVYLIKDSQEGYHVDFVPDEGQSRRLSCWLCTWGRTVKKAIMLTLSVPDEEQ